MYATTRLPDDWTPEVIGKMLGDGFHLGPTRALQLAYLDTFDWRIAAAGSRLWRETASGRSTLHWVRQHGVPIYTVPIGLDPVVADDLPEGFLQNEIAPLIGVRALITVGSCRIRRHVAGIRDHDGNSAVHLHLERVRFLVPSGKATGTTLSVAHVFGAPGLERVFERTVEGFASLVPGGGGALDLLELAAAQGGRSIGDYSSKIRFSLDRDMASEAALRQIVSGLLETLVANVDGSVNDLDTEFLHDLRVAARRTRTALTQIKGVVPKNTIKPFLEGFKWLGSVTGECRDLDVHLQDIRRYRRAHPDLDEALDPLTRAVEEARARAYEDVRTGLRSRRFADLVCDWEAYLEGPTPGVAPAKARRPIRITASKTILKAYRRMVDRGVRLGEDPSAGELHRLRIDGKNLRYLLEFFRSLYPAKKVDRLIKELKTVQDVLGGFNDAKNQQTRLDVFMGSMDPTEESDAMTLVAVEHLTAALEQRQEDIRRTFAGQFRSFAHPKSQDLYQSLFGSEV